jgi:hypothetical protein
MKRLRARKGFPYGLIRWLAGSVTSFLLVQSEFTEIKTGFDLPGMQRIAILRYYAQTSASI